MAFLKANIIISTLDKYGALSGSKLNVQTFSSLNFETSLFAYNYFLIAALAACSNVNEVYSWQVPAKKYFFLRVC